MYCSTFSHTIKHIAVRQGPDLLIWDSVLCLRKLLHAVRRSQELNHQRLMIRITNYYRPRGPRIKKPVISDLTAAGSVALKLDLYVLHKAGVCHTNAT